MYYKCSKCGRIVDDGDFSNKICASCILYPADESRSEDDKSKIAQIVIPEGVCCDMCGVADTKLYYCPVGLQPMYVCGNCAFIMMM